jgi:hypothetical protein
MLSCRSHRLVLAIGVLVIACAPKAPEAHPTPVPQTYDARAIELAGCYGLILGMWSDSGPKPGPTGLIPRRLRVPTLVRLDTNFLTFRDPRRRVRRLLPQSPDLTGGRVLHPGWILRSADSVELFWSSGYSGIQLFVKAHGDTLRGRAQTFSDVQGGTEPHAPVALRRAPCSATLGPRVRMVDGEPDFNQAPRRSALRQVAFITHLIAAASNNDSAEAIWQTAYARSPPVANARKQ